MEDRIKRASGLFRSTFAIVLVALFWASADPFQARAQQTVDRVVASVDGSPITMGDVVALGASTGRPVDPFDPAQKDKVMALLKDLIAQKMLDQQVTKYADKVSAEQVDRYIAEFRKDKQLNEEEFRQALKQRGVSYADFRRHARLELERMTMLDQELRQKVNVSLEKIKAYYQSHPEEFTVKEEKIKLAQILIATPPGSDRRQILAARKKALDLRKMLLGGADFASMARRFSDDSSRTNGGDLGYFSPSEMMPAMLLAIKGLEPGEISKVVHTDYGYHILKLEDHQKPGVLPLDDVKDKIRAKLTNEMAKQRYQRWVDKDLIKEHYVETLF